MIKNLFTLFFVLLLLANCKHNKLIKTHGLSYLENREKLIIVNKSNKNDTVEILGQPASKGLTDDNVWIYIERTKTRGKLLKLGRSYLDKNNVLVLEFNKYGVLEKKDFYDKEKMKKVNFAKKTTDNDLRKENFIYSFLSSIRQKMLTKQK
jgi:outer membrane protein assembly factor BamE (lipoprotein component of BamABCDE complex)